MIARFLVVQITVSDYYMITLLHDGGTEGSRSRSEDVWSEEDHHPQTTNHNKVPHVCKTRKKKFTLHVDAVTIRYSLSSLGQQARYRQLANRQ